MSCRSVPLSSAAVSAARGSSGLTESQVQSLFHGLRREGAECREPTREEYDRGLDGLAMRIRHDAAIPEHARARALARVEQARGSTVPDGRTWHAVQWLDASAAVASAALDRACRDVDADLGLPSGSSAGLLAQWRDARPGSFDDYPAPDPAYRLDLRAGVPADERTARALRKLGYEQYLAQPLPVFVYGTLRQGCHNHHLMDGAREEVRSATADGVAVYRSGHGFPYAAEHPDPQAVTVGEVVWLSDDAAGWNARARLDLLEGFDSDRPARSHYERVQRDVLVRRPGGGPAEPTRAWVYLARGHARDRLREQDRVQHGDWVADLPAR